MKSVTDPPYLEGPSLDVYVFSDGAGEITIRTPLAGRNSYRATGHVVGRGGPLPLRCAAGCGSDSTTVRYAGLEYDLGPLGWAQVYVISRNRDHPNTNTVAGSEACLFPNPDSPPNESSKPADHPYGCGLPPYSNQRETVDAAFRAVDLAVNAVPTSGNGSVEFWTEAKGHQYLGGRALAAGVEARSIQIFAIAFRYGIH